MALILAQSFMKQLKRLPQKEQGVVSRTVLDLQIDPTAATLSIHKVDGDAGWWSAYANGDLRIIFARRKDGEMVLCWTDHHDAAYLWARRHVLTEHPITKSMQLVEIPELFEEPKQEAPKPAEKKSLFRPICDKLGIEKEDLLRWGVPEIWTEKVLHATEEDELLDIGEKHLPADAAEVVLLIAVGERPSEPESVDDSEKDTGWNEQSWWVVSDDDDLKSALENCDWDTWCRYLHPMQKKIAYKTYNGHYRVCGSAGTGKTVVALHHAKHILESDKDARVLIATYSGVLAKDLRKRCLGLLGPLARERCKITTISEFARDEYDRLFPDHRTVIHRKELRAETIRYLNAHENELPKGISPRFALSEFERVVEPRQIHTENEYLQTLRRGVHTKLSADKRKKLWGCMRSVYEYINEYFKYITVAQMFFQIGEYYRQHPCRPRYFTNIIVDECQDLCEVELDFLSAYLGESGQAFFAGDIGQRIIHYSFPWKQHGVDLRGRSKVLKVNYRTTHEIRAMADKLTELEALDADDIQHRKRGTVSLLSGPKPEMMQFEDINREIDGVATWLNHLYNDLHVPPNAVAVFYRSDKEQGRAVEAVKRSLYGMCHPLPNVVQMFQAKGLEYQAAVVMACDNGVIPSPDRLAEADLVAGIEEIYDTERNLLYVACTRARDYLLITSAGIPSELLLDMM